MTLDRTVSEAAGVDRPKGEDAQDFYGAIDSLDAYLATLPDSAERFKARAHLAAFAYFAAHAADIPVRSALQ